MDHLVRAVDLAVGPDLTSISVPEGTLEPVHNPIVNENEPDHAVPNIDSELKTANEIPQNSAQSPVQLIPKHPVIELVKTNPANVKLPTATTRVVPTAPGPSRVSSRQKSRVEKLNYSKLGGN